MFHRYEVAVNDSTGVPIAGVEVRLYDASDNLVSIYSDNAGTPIINVSGIADTAVSDDAGNYSYYVVNGVYTERLYVGDSLAYSIPDVVMQGFVTTIQTPTFAGAATIATSSDTNLVIVSGTSAVGDSGTGRQFAYDATVDAAYVAANPTTSFVDATGRGFKEIPGADAASIAAELALKVATADLASTAAGKGAALVGFLQSGTGTVAGTVDAELRRALAPAQFGVAGDGVTNDATAFQKAVTEAAASKRPLHLSGGLTFKLASTVVIGSDVTITGDGTCTIKAGANVTLLKVTGSRVNLSGFKIDGQRATYTSNGNNGIQVDWTGAAGSDVVIDRVRVKSVGGIGLFAQASASTASSGVAITNCHVEDTGAHGILCQDYVSRVRIIGNEVYYTGMNTADRPGITASRYGTDVIVSNNIVVGSASALGTSCHGISIDLTSDAVCNSNTVRGWKGIGIELAYVTGGAFAGNNISACTYGINLSGQNTATAINKHCAITGNSIRDCGGPGIGAAVTSATGTYLHQDITISGNNVYGSTGVAPGSGYGYKLNHIDGLTFIGNKAYGCDRSGAYFEDCPNHFIDGLHLLKNNLSGGLKTATSVTASGTTATVTLSGHGYSTGDFVGVWGASPTEYNQNSPATITVVDADTFTYALPRSGLASPASGTIYVGKAAGLSEAGLRVAWSLFAVGARGFNRLGSVVAAYNGFRDVYDISVNGLTGLHNDSTLYLKERGAVPRVENFTSGISANVKDHVGMYMKNGKLTFAYNNAGTLNYLVIPLDGATTTFTNGATAP